MSRLILRCFAVATLLVPVSAFAQFDIEREPINYLKGPVSDPISRLQMRLDEAEVRLTFDLKSGYLESVLKTLNVSETSQMLVFSKTSFQRNRINPRTPRAIYFNDDVYIGWCVNGDVVEVTAVDPQLGGVFYSLDQEEVDRPKFARHTDTCTLCHASSVTQGVPGHLVRSVFPDSVGNPILSTTTYRTTYQSPLKQRWGGWYVSGTHGQQRHMGNMIAKSSREPEAFDVDAGANVTDLSKLINVEPYLAPHSDIVAFLVFEHQAPAHNALTLANYQAKLALRDEEILRKMDKDPDAPRTESIQRRLDHSADLVLKHFLFVEEAPLTDRVQGVSGFAEQFAARGPHDKQGRSLRDFDLQTRIFRYPCSYLIYSAAFDGLPSELKAIVWQKLHNVLTGVDQSSTYQHLSAEDRLAILEILRDTKQNLPASWRK
ncbi:MAG: signal peptide-domain containing protein [Planctomycetota bacterium]|nr:MAG: signal peptide-domain containing protein [Planctomycetota bacterium]